jgi:hypothetical protein
MISVRRTLVASLACVWPAVAQAEPPVESRAAQADRLFQEGKQLIERGKYAEACPRLAESQSIDPGSGTLLALALCHESEGKTASAWREFREAALLCERAGRADRVQLARAHLASLDVALTKLVIRVSEQAAGTGLALRLDAQPIARDEWNQAVPVDPGPHAIDASAPGMKPWSTKLVVAGTGGTQVVVVPALDPEPAPSAATRPWAPTSAYVAAGIGLVSLGLGTGFGVRAVVKANEVRSMCPSSPCDRPDVTAINNDAKTAAWVADVGIGVGLAAVAVAAVLVVRGSPARKGTARVSVAPLAGTGAGLSLGGTF